MTLLSLLLACAATEPAAPVASVEAVPAAAPAPAAASAEAAWRDITPAELNEMEPKPYVVDVRTPEEYAAGHVPGAVNLPLQELGGRIGELEAQRGQPMALICAVGGRSMAATQQLAAAGYTELMNVDGGTNGWIALGLPVE